MLIAPIADFLVEASPKGWDLLIEAEGGDDDAVVKLVQYEAVVEAAEAVELAVDRAAYFAEVDGYGSVSAGGVVVAFTRHVDA